MKKLLQLIITLAILGSCNQKPVLDRMDVKSVPNYLINAIQKNDTISFLQLFNYQLDPKITDSAAVKNLNLTNFENAYDTFKGKKVGLLDYDTLDGLDGGELIDDTSLNTYVQVDDTFYKLRLTHHTSIKENYFLVFYLINLSSECDMIRDKPYQPSSFRLFPNLNWDTYNGHIFNNVSAVFDNLTEYDIKKIKFRLTIENPDKIIFKQTIISEEPIYKGDIKGITINELRGVDAGFLLRKENFDWNIEVLEVEPKPVVNPCAKIEQLGVKN